MPPAVMQLDNSVKIVTPENIAFEYRLAGPFLRLMAYAIDWAIRAAVFAVAAIILLIGFGTLQMAGLGVGAVMVLWFIMSWFYGGLFETFWNGQTPGKRAMRLRVLTTDGQPINASQAVLRNILRFVDSMPITPFPGSDQFLPVLPLYLLGFLTAAMSPRFQRLGDLACGTLVVIEDRQALRGMIQITDPGALALAANLPANCRVNQQLARALSSYVSRRLLFSVARRGEIARALAEPLCEQFELPRETNPDHLLCALYLRTFIADRAGRDEIASSARPPEAAAEDPLSFLTSGR